jgi:hypothetical protein
MRPFSLNAVARLDAVQPGTRATGAPNSVATLANTMGLWEIVLPRVPISAGQKIHGASAPASALDRNMLRCLPRGRDGSRRSA